MLFLFPYLYQHEKVCSAAYRCVAILKVKQKPQFKGFVAPRYLEPVFSSQLYCFVEIIIVIFVEHYPYPVKSKLTCPLKLIFFIFCPLYQRTCRTSSPFNNWRQHLRIIVGYKGFKIIGFGLTSLTYNKKTDYFGPHFFSTLLCCFCLAPYQLFLLSLVFWNKSHSMNI